jgi:prefoldin subunit 5
MQKLGQLGMAEKFKAEERIQKLEASKEMVAQINRNLSHEIMLPLNAVCFVPAKIVETNHVIFFLFIV